MTVKIGNGVCLKALRFISLTAGFMNAGKNFLCVQIHHFRASFSTAAECILLVPVVLFCHYLTVTWSFQMTFSFVLISCYWPPNTGCLIIGSCSQQV